MPEQEGIMHAIKLTRQSNDVDVFWAQAMHHRARRLDWLEHLETEGFDPEDMKHRRLKPTSENMNWRSTKSATKANRNLEEGAEVKFEISNCHQVLWTGNVGLGTPAQPFTVHVDTGGTDLWVASDLCDGGCTKIVGTSRYKQNDSNTYQKLGDDSTGVFKISYGSQEIVEGQYGKDLLSFGNELYVPDTTFAQVTKFSTFKTCAGEEGVLGLGTSDTTAMNKWPSPIAAMKPVLRYPMFALHLDAMKDDYAVNDLTAKSAQSEIVLGGVNRKNYFGCLQWHPLGQFDDDVSAHNLNNYWNFKLSNTHIGDEEIDGTNIAVVDSGSTYIVGPSWEVGKFADKNKAMCFQLNDSGDIDENSQVDCFDAKGFDIGVVPCNEEFEPLIFHANGQQFKLTKDELVMPVETTHGTLCVLKLNGSATIPGWVLGDPFMSRFYAVFDFGEKRLGFARSARNSQDVCVDDTHLDLNTYHPDPDIISIGVSKDKPKDKNTITSTHPLHKPQGGSGLSAGGIVGIFFGIFGFLGLSFYMYRKRSHQKTDIPPGLDVEELPPQQEII